MNLGKNIKKYRKEKGITQEDLAKKCDLSKNGLWNYENGKREPNIDTLNKIARALDVTIHDLIGPNTMLKMDSTVEGDGEILYPDKIKDRVILDLLCYCNLTGVTGVFNLTHEDKDFIFDTILYNFISLSKKCSNQYYEDNK